MGKKTKAINESIPWVEKYRPSNIDDIIGQEEIKRNIKNHLEESSIMNMLFSGEEGLGKTTMAVAIARILTKNDEQNLKYVNASMFGRQDFLKNEIIPFCKASTLGDAKKVIILDEFDFASSQMQASFRRVMEHYSTVGNCIFILICNFERKIMAAIKSRSAKFEFRKVDVKILVDRGKFILIKEKIKFNDEDLEKLAESSEGKPRNFIMNLQKYSMKGELKIEEEVQLKFQVMKMLRHIFKLEYRNLEDALSIYIETNTKISDNAREILIIMYDLLMSNEKLKEKPDYKAKILRAISETDYKLSLDTNQRIQMCGLLVTLYYIATPYVNEERKSGTIVPQEE